MPWHLAPGRVLWGSAAVAATALTLIGSLLWWRAGAGGPRPADEAQLAGVLSAPPTAPATFTTAPEATATRPPNSPFPPTATPLPAMIDYVVQSGDTMYAIAFKYNVTLDDILAANAETLSDVNSLSLGQVLRIPLRGLDAVEEAAAEAGEDSSAEVAASDAGDEDAEARAEAPPAREGSQAAQATEPPATDADAPPVEPGEPIVVQEALTYVVDRGDTLGRISAEYGVSVEELVRNNDLSGPNALLSVGQEVVVAPAVLETTTPAPTTAATPVLFAESEDPQTDALPREDSAEAALMRAPLPLAPGREVLVADIVATLRWASAGELPSGAYYVVTLRLPEEPEAEDRHEWLLGGGNALRVPAGLRPAPGAQRVIEWSVSVRRERRGLLAEEAGLQISEPGPWRRFTWAPGAEQHDEDATSEPTALPEPAASRMPGDREPTEEATEAADAP